MTVPSQTVFFNNSAPNASASVTNIVGANINTLTVTNVVAINTNSGANGTFNILASHTFPSTNNFPFSITITDARTDMAVATNFIVTTGVTMTMPGTITNKLSRTNIILSWAGPSFTLQSSTNVAGPWNIVAGATSPYTNPITGPRQFFRMKSQ